MKNPFFNLHHDLFAPHKSAQAYWITRIHTQEKKPTLVCVPDMKSLTALHNETLHLSVENPPLTLFYPSDEKELFIQASLNIPYLHQRLSVLHHFTSNPSEYPLIFTTLAGLCQNTLPPCVYQKHCQHLKVGQSYHQQSLQEFFLTAGFRIQDPVLSPGSFIFRPEVLDIILCNGQAWRLHFFDTLLESISALNIDTQLSSTAAKSLFISPAHEFLIEQEKLQAFQSLFHDQTQQEGVSLIERKELWSTFEHNTLSHPYRRHLKAYYQKASQLLDFISTPFNLIWIHKPACQAYFQTLQNISPEAPFGGSFDAFFQPFPENHTQEYRLWNIAFEGMPSTLELVPSFVQKDALFAALTQWSKQAFEIFFFLSRPYELEVFKNHFKTHFAIHYIPTPLYAGFLLTSEKKVFLSEKELLGHHPKPKPLSKSKKEVFQLSEIENGDLVVHHRHGIGIYQGLKRLEQEGRSIDFVMIAYAKEDKLYIPVYNLTAIHKYIGPKGHAPLYRLGSFSFQKAKAIAQETTERLAIDLLKIFATRQSQKGFQHQGPTEEYRAFEADFTFIETEDQSKAIADVCADMESGRIMDRLICGDVGFGKTEVAMRAAFKAVQDGKQVAVLVPTTLLCDQHERTFKERFKNHPFHIASLSRFKTPKAQKTILAGLQKGTIDILIGTHRLLSDDVVFHDLGLLILDEEQRFGVHHKEKLSALRTDTHVLTLTATPIPRTLQLGLVGIKDISLITTPPIDRLAIKTLIIHEKQHTLQKVITFERDRGGQILFLCNTIEKLPLLAKGIQASLPHIKIAIAHGKVPEKTLATIMRDFYARKTDILFCTTIIESGIDLPYANTIIIKDAHTFGLTQLYQIRGRVGRNTEQAYCYLMTPENRILSEKAVKRLHLIENFVALGSGFNIATHDLEIRGAGTLLGAEQSGQSSQIGDALFLEMLEEAIQSLQGKKTTPQEPTFDPDIHVPYSTFIPETYIPQTSLRLKIYRTLSGCKDNAALDKQQQEIIQRFGSLPLEAQHLFWLIRLKILLKKHQVTKCLIGKQKSVLTFQNKAPHPIEGLFSLSFDALYFKIQTLLEDQQQPSFKDKTLNI